MTAVIFPDWLRSVPKQQLLTLEFAFDSGKERAKQHIKELINLEIKRLFPEFSPQELVIAKKVFIRIMDRIK